MARVHRQLRALPHRLDNLVHLAQVQAGVHPLAVKVHGHGDNVHVAGALTVAHQCALDPVGTGEHSQFRRGDSATPVVVGVQRDQQAVAVGHVITKPLDLVGVHIGGAHLHRRRQIEDYRPCRRRLPDRRDGVADLYRKLELGAGETLRGVLEHPFRLRLPGSAVAYQFRTLDRNIDNALAIEGEYLFPLYRGRGVIDVHNGAAHAFEGIEGFLDQVGPGLGQHLYGDIVRNTVVLDQFAHELIVMARGRGKADLDFLEPNFYQLVPQARLLARGHGLDQGLVAVAQIDATPTRRRLDHPVGPAAARHGNGLERLVFAMVEVAHVVLPVLVSPSGRLFVGLSRAAAPAFLPLRQNPWSSTGCSPVLHPGPRGALARGSRNGNSRFPRSRDRGVISLEPSIGARA